MRALPLMFGCLGFLICIPAVGNAGSVGPTFSDYVISFPCPTDETVVSIPSVTAGDVRRLHRYECSIDGTYFRADFGDGAGIFAQAVHNEGLMEAVMLEYADAYGIKTPEVSISDIPPLGTEVLLRGIMPTQDYGMLRAETRFYFQGNQELQALILAMPGAYPSRSATAFFASVAPSRNRIIDLLPPGFVIEE